MHDRRTIFATGRPVIPRPGFPRVLAALLGALACGILSSGAASFSFTSGIYGPTAAVGCPVYASGSGVVYYRQPPSTGWNTLGLPAQLIAPCSVNQAYASYNSWYSLLSYQTSAGATQTKTTGEQSRTYEWTRNTGAGVQGSFTVTIPACEVSHTRSGSGSSLNAFNVSQVTVNFGDGSQPVTVDNPNSPPIPNPLLELAGKELTLPLVGAPNSTLSLEIGGKTYQFPTDEFGLANVTLTIPEGWDGTAKVNGDVVALAPKVAYAGTPGISGLFANPYDSALPAGMTKWSPSGSYTFPPGMTYDSAALPAGVTVTENLSPPASLSTLPAVGATFGQFVEYNLTSAGVTTSYILDTRNASGTPATQTGGSTSGTGGVSSSNPVGASAPTGEVSEAGEIAGYDGAFSEGQALQEPDKATADKLLDVKNSVVSKFSDLNPLAPGQGIPRADSYHFDMSFGPLGSSAVNIDFSQQPWPSIRMAFLAVLVLGAGHAFLKRVSI